VADAVTLTARALPSWWDDCRYGMFVHANLATVPAFAPVHEYADWYWSHLEPKADVVLHPTSPLPEVMAWHAEHWPGVAFDDFAPRLTFEQFDADAYAELARDAGMRYMVPVTKHHDGFCFWDSALTDRTSTHVGPHRDVISELAAAAERAQLRFGLYYSLLDWSHPAYPDADAYVDAYMRPQIRELVERFAPSFLWGDGHWGHPPFHWRSDEIVSEYYEAMQRLGLEGCVNDRFWASHSDFMVYEYDVPERVPDRPWELCRGLSYSFCVNQAEEPDDFLDGAAVVAMLVETIAKVGHLLLNVGPDATGAIPEIQSRALRDAGEWVHAHAAVVHESQPFVTPGEGSAWITVAPGERERGVTALNVVDTESRDRLVVAGLGLGAGRVVSVARSDGAELGWNAVGDALEITTPRAGAPELADVYRVEIELRDTSRVIIRSAIGDGSVSRNGVRAPSLHEALAQATTSDVITLGTGRYTDGPYPLKVRAGVTLRAEPGLAANAVVIEGGGNAVIDLAAGATLEGVTVVGGATGYMFIPPTCVTARNADALTIRACVVEAIAIAGGSGHRIEANVVAGGNIALDGASDSIVAANYQHGLRWGVGIDVSGGADVTIEHNECHDDLCAIRVSDAAGARVERNRIRSRWFAVHVRDSVGATVRRNQISRTMRAVSIEGGSDHTVEHNLAERCDTGVLLERGAAATRVSENWLHGCRVGILGWDEVGTRLTGNAISEPRHHAVVANRLLATAGNDLGGGSVWFVPSSDTSVRD
jgi:alpha-L-fucosidase